MAKYRVYLSSSADVTVHVEVDDDLDEQDARQAAIEKAFEEAPSNSLCIHCSGYGQSWSRDLGEMDVARESDGAEVQPERVDA